MKKIIALTVCLILLSQPAEAVRGRRPNRPIKVQDGLKSKTTARQLSYGCTFIPVAAGAAIMGFSLGKSPGQETTGSILGLTIAGLGIVVGPITGHIYAGKRSTPGLGLRIAGLVTLGLGGLVAARTDSFFKEGSFEVSDGAELAMGLFACSSVLLLAASVADLATVGRSVDEYNRKHTSGRLSIAPGYNTTSETFSLTATLRF